MHAVRRIAGLKLEKWISEIIVFADLLLQRGTMKKKTPSSAKIDRRIEQFRKKLDSSPAAIACCYFYLGSAMLFGRAQYVCPVCGEKTFLGIRSKVLAEHLDEVHRFEKRMWDRYGFSIHLDERFFCDRCCPPEMEAESWIIEFRGKRFFRKLDDDDIPLLNSFFGKEKIFDFSRAMNEPFNIIDRLRVLFGMEEEGNVKKSSCSPKRFPALSILPETAVLEMTYRCNHECLFCSCPWYADMIPRGRELDTAEWKALIQEYAENGVTTFAFTGGEALLRPDLPEILEYAASRTVKRIDCDLAHGFQLREGKPDLVLLSNGRGLTDEMLQFCRDHAIHLSLSLPGLESFPVLTGSGMSADHLLGRLRKAAEFGLESTAAIAVTTLNLNELRTTIQVAFESGAGAILLNRFLPGGRGLEHPELTLTPAQVLEMFRIADAVLAEWGKKGYVGTETPRCMLDKCEPFHNLNVESSCAAARDFFVTGPSGMIRVCNHSPRELVYWRQWRELKNHPVWREYAFRRYLPEACAGCEMRLECAAGCRAAADVVTGSSKGLEPCLKIFLKQEHPIVKQRWRKFVSAFLGQQFRFRLFRGRLLFSKFFKRRWQ